MSDDEFYMAVIEKRNRQRLIERGVRYDPVQGAPPERGVPEVVQSLQKKARQGRKRRRK